MLRRFPTLALASLVAAFGLLAACSTVSVGTAEAPIVGGQVDPGHAAVVALTMTKPGPRFPKCTGTMIAVDADAHLGYVLTAAHCMADATDVRVQQGNDRSDVANLVEYAMLDYRIAPGYPGFVPSSDDVALVRVVGVDATTPTIPLVGAGDSIGVRSAVVSVGFGRTVPPEIPSDAAVNTKKYRIDGSIAAESDGIFTVRYPGGSTCVGDSGGPLIAMVGGREVVVGVQSTAQVIDGVECQGTAGHVDVKKHAAFFASVLALPAPAASCSVCRKQSVSGRAPCGEAKRSCSADRACDAVRACVDACTFGTPDAGADGCAAACRTTDPVGAAAYDAEVTACPCRSCADACSDDPACH